MIKSYLPVAAWDKWAKANHRCVHHPRPDHDHDGGELLHRPVPAHRASQQPRHDGDAGPQGHRDEEPRQCSHSQRFGLI